MSRHTKAPRGRPQSIGGFTLIEVLIVVVIVGILLAISLPSYQESIRKGRRADAKAGLLDAANRQERLILDISRYTLDMTELGFAADPMISQEGDYSIDSAACGTGIATCYIVTATPRPGSPQVKDTKCTSFSLGSNGQKTATGTLGNECW